MGRFTVIPADTFKALQLDAGVLLKTFDPSSPTVTDEAIITATTGGVQIAVTPTYSDTGEDVDNCPVNTKELKHLDSWEVTLSTTSLGTSPDLIKFALGAAEVTTASGKVTPGTTLKQTYFSTMWWVGDKADGGFVAAKLINALSTGGFSLQTSKNGKGQTAITITCHPSISAQDVVPVEFYSIDGEEPPKP